MLRIIALVAVALFSVGCSSMNLQKPTAAVTGMNITGVDVNGFTMDFAVDLKNPNTTPLPLSTADYRLGFAGVNVLEGKAKPQGSIPAGGSRTVTLPVTLTYENLLAAEKVIVQTGGDVPYALDGGLSIDTGAPLLGSMRVPLQYNGTLKMRDILNNPQWIMQNPAAQKLAKHFIGGFFNR